MKKQEIYQVQYQNKIIPYQVIPSPIKNLYIYIREGKVIVKVPKFLKDKQIQEFVHQKAKWIGKKIEQERSEIETPILQEDRERLETIVRSKIEKYSELLKEKPNRVRIRDIKYAWGSCSSNKNITINLKLAKKEEEVIEYVIVHEMCHLKYMNHSKEFWRLVENYIPEYKKYRASLK